VNWRVDIDGLRLRSLNELLRMNPKARARLVAKEREQVCIMLLGKIGLTPPKLPLVVTIVRIGPKALDGHDNLPGACKSTVDEVTRYLGLTSDADARVTWAYRQERGKYGVRLEIAGRERGT